jgi:hypothetical protein
MELATLVSDATGWLSIDYEQDPRGRWRGEGAILEQLMYVDPSERPQPAPWIPRYWRAVDLPELAADNDVTPAPSESRQND